MNDSDVVICHAAMVLEERKKCELTQQQLAEQSGYSVRAIRKAESGEKIRFSTVVAIATAMQQCGSKATALDFCTDPVAVAQAFVEAYRIHEERMVEKIRHLLSADLEIFIAGDPSKIPFAGNFHGPEGLQEFWNRFFQLIERYDKEALDVRYYACGSDVVAYGTEKGRIIGHDTDAPTWLCLRFEIQDGVIVKFEDYFDTASAQHHFHEFAKRRDEVSDNAARHSVLETLKGILCLASGTQPASCGTVHCVLPRPQLSRTTCPPAMHLIRPGISNMMSKFLHRLTRFPQTPSVLARLALDQFDCQHSLNRRRAIRPRSSAARDIYSKSIVPIRWQ